MICKDCGNEAVLANAGLTSYTPYFYCRTCKKELELEKLELEKVAQELQDEIEKLTARILLAPKDKDEEYLPF